MSELGWVILTLIIFAAGLAALRHMAKIHVPYSRRVFVGLGFGVILGIGMQVFLGAESHATELVISWTDVVGQGYVAFLQMLVVPLVLISMIRAFTEMDQTENIGKIGAGVLSVLIGTVMVAAAIGLGSALLFGLDGATFAEGAAESARIVALKEQQAQVGTLSLPEQLVSFIPTNIFNDLAGARPTSILAVVVFAVMVGTAYLGVARKQPEQGEMFKRIIDSLHAIVMRIVTLVLRMAPYGTMALILKMVATSSLTALVNLGTFVVASYSALIIMFIIHLVLLFVFRIHPVTYLKKAWSALSFAFTSRSSAGALPLNIQTQREAFGVDAATANFAATFGVSIGQNGCAGIYPAMLVAIVGPTVGMDFSDPKTWLTVIVTIAISSFGVAGVGGGATFASLIVFGALDLPVEMIGLLVSVEPMIDMGRTALNVSDSMVAGLVTAKRRGTLDEAVFRDDNAQVTSAEH